MAREIQKEKENYINKQVKEDGGRVSPTPLLTLVINRGQYMRKLFYHHSGGLESKQRTSKINERL